MNRTLACWLDELSGLPCQILLGDRGENSGYVGVPPAHPYYAMPSDLLGLRVYGGVTFVGEIHRADEENPLSRLFSVWEGDSLFVIGFDCGHGSDFVPGRVLPDFVPGDSLNPGEIRDDEFVRRECIFLAEQLARAAPLE